MDPHDSYRAGSDRWAGVGWVRRASLDGGWDGTRAIRRSCTPRNLWCSGKGIFFRPSAPPPASTNRILCWQIPFRGMHSHPPGQKRFGIFLSTLRLDWWRFPPPPRADRGLGRLWSIFSPRLDSILDPSRTKRDRDGIGPVGSSWWGVPGTPLPSTSATCSMDSHPPFPSGTMGQEKKKQTEAERKGEGCRLRSDPSSRPRGTGLHATRNANQMAESQSTHHRTAAPSDRTSVTCFKTTVQV